MNKAPILGLNTSYCAATTRLIRTSSPDTALSGQHAVQQLAGPVIVRGSVSTRTTWHWILELQTKVRGDFAITDKAPARPFFWLKAPTGCPTIEYSLCFGCFLGFQCSYRCLFYHFSTAQEMTIPKLTLLSSLRLTLIKLQSKT